MNPRRRRERAGRSAETVAAAWLVIGGWRILARRLRTPMGEIDLIARRGTTLAFVEVKWRSGPDPGLLDPARYRRVWAAASALAPRFQRQTDSRVRVDLILIAPWRLPRHIADVRPGL